MCVCAHVFVNSRVCTTNVLNSSVSLKWVGQLLMGFVSVGHESEHEETVRVDINLGWRREGGREGGREEYVY